MKRLLAALLLCTALPVAAETRHQIGKIQFQSRVPTNILLSQSALAEDRTYTDQDLDVAMARLHESRGEYEQALERYRIATKARPASPGAWGDIARLKLRLAEFDGELDNAIRSASRLGPWEPDVQLVIADVAMQEAAVKNAQIAYDRALALVKTSSGTQKNLDDAEAALRTAQARINSSQTRLARRKAFDIGTQRDALEAPIPVKF